jgi:exonuclease III
MTGRDLLTRLRTERDLIQARAEKAAMDVANPQLTAGQASELAGRAAASRTAAHDLGLLISDAEAILLSERTLLEHLRAVVAELEAIRAQHVYLATSSQSSVASERLRWMAEGEAQFLERLRTLTGGGSK